MKIQATYKSAIVNGKILEFAQITLKERMKKQQGDIEGQIAALMQKNETHKEWFDAIVQSKPPLPYGVMKYEDILKKMGDSAVSLKDWLDEKIKEELERKMKEDIAKQVDAKIEEEKINIQRDADEIKNIQNKLAAKNDENYRLEERNRELSIEINNKDKDHAAALEAIKQKNLTSQQQEIVKEQNKNLKLQQEITELKTQLFNKSQLERQFAELERQFAELERQITENLLTIKNLNEKNHKNKYDCDQTIEQLKDKIKNINADAKTALDESLKIAKKEYFDKLNKTQRDHESQLAAEKANCQQKMMELTKTIVLLKMNLDLKEQQTINSKSTFVPSTTNVIKLTNSNTEKAKNLLEKSKMKGGGRKSRLFMKGGATYIFEYETDDVINTNNINDINIFTKAQMDEFEKNIAALQEKIESLKKELETSKTSASTDNTNEKLIKELILIKANFSIIHNNFLLEKIANMTNQQIIKLTNAANTNLKGEKTKLEGEKTTLENANKMLETDKTNLTNANKILEGEKTALTSQLNSTSLTANTATAISKASATLPRNPKVFISDNGRVMFSEHK